MNEALAVGYNYFKWNRVRSKRGFHLQQRETTFMETTMFLVQNIILSKTTLYKSSLQVDMGVRLRVNMDNMDNSKDTLLKEDTKISNSRISNTEDHLNKTTEILNKITATLNKTMEVVMEVPLNRRLMDHKITSGHRWDSKLTCLVLATSIVVDPRKL